VKGKVYCGGSRIREDTVFQFERRRAVAVGEAPFYAAMPSAATAASGRRAGDTDRLAPGRRRILYAHTGVLMADRIDTEINGHRGGRIIIRDRRTIAIWIVRVRVFSHLTALVKTAIISPDKSIRGTDR